jgi:hypothetical protein
MMVVAVVPVDAAVEVVSMPVVVVVAKLAAVVVAASVEIGVTHIPDRQHRIVADADADGFDCHTGSNGSDNTRIQGDACEGGE